MHFLIGLGLAWIGFSALMWIIGCLFTCFNFTIDKIKDGCADRWSEETGRDANEFWATPPPGGWPNDPRNVQERQRQARLSEEKERWKIAREKDPSLPENPPPRFVLAAAPLTADQVAEKAAQQATASKSKKPHPLAVIFAVCFCLAVAVFALWAWVSCTRAAHLPLF